MTLTQEEFDALPEAAKALFEKQADGTYAAQKAGPPPKDPRIDEFRDNNIALKKQLDELQAKFAGIDPEQVEMARAAMDKARSDKERELIKAGQFDQVFEMRLAELKASHQKEMAKLQEQAEAERERVAKFRTGLEDTKVQSHVLSAAAQAKLQILPTAQADFVRRAREIYRIDDAGEVVALDAEGQPRLNKEHRPFTEADFFAQIIEEAPHLFVPGKGANVDGPGGRRTGGQFTISADDSKGFSQNLEKIADGDVDVRMEG